MYTDDTVVVVGAGLAGCEAAWQIAQHGVRCRLLEMRPGRMTPAHRSGALAELVCSNSFGSALPDRAAGLLQEEMRRCGSIVMEAAADNKVPAGGALAVDRDAFAAQVTAEIGAHPLIRLERVHVSQVPISRPAVIATGPLTSDDLAESLARTAGRRRLFFYDAMAPLVEADSINMDICFPASRYGRGDSELGDYLNCPLNREQYDRLVRELVAADKAPLREFEQRDGGFFEGCLPVEEIARRGELALAYGPLRPVGLTDPRTGRRPYAVVQLRRDNRAATMYNMVGFQTNLTYPEQKRVLRLVPGLEAARFVRLGQMHRNTFLNSPSLLRPTLEMKGHPGLFIAGQLAGIEGYVGSIASGWLAGINAARTALGQILLSLPIETMAGALMDYVANADVADFQPMKANFGILPRPLHAPKRKRDRSAALSARALSAMERFLAVRLCAPNAQGPEANEMMAGASQMLAAVQEV